ncbi:hypothetical protein [Nocardioides nitrophenolicus]|uniref:hypothetical protein n=1 Tax=Nocardioides nitrophenolicus TaxID=60489 RepID=UPI00195EA731|nr:hypothetical protein [Nocardioides nitrophenolicus]MBM7515525.1 uncharacterized protein YecT (DUF1311 family) [Nocardioides nitrophenolicus]
MHRALFKMFIGLAVALGLTFTTASVSSAAPAAPARQEPAADCSAQGQALTKAYNNYGAANAYVAAADAKVKKFKKKLKKAKKHHAPAKKITKLKKKLKKAKKAKRAGIAYRNQTVAAYNGAYAAYATCKGRPNAAPPATPELPVQALCDLVPQLQPLCDAFGSALDPLMTTFDTFCAMAPAEAKPLCDALKAGLTNPTGLVDILRATLSNLGLGTAVDALDPVLDLLDTILKTLGGGLPGGLPSIPGLPSLPGLPGAGGGNPLCSLGLPLPGLC